MTNQEWQDLKRYVAPNDECSHDGCSHDGCTVDTTGPMVTAECGDCGLTVFYSRSLYESIVDVKP